MKKERKKSNPIICDMVKKKCDTVKKIKSDSVDAVKKRAKKTNLSDFKKRNKLPSVSKEKNRTAGHILLGRIGLDLNYTKSYSVSITRRTSAYTHTRSIKNHNT